MLKFLVELILGNFMLKQNVKYVVATLVVGYAASYPFVTDKKRILPVFKEGEKIVSTGKIRVISEPKFTNVHLPDFASISNVQEKKHAFFTFMKPFVYEVNNEILKQRESVERFDPNNATEADIDSITKLARKYRIKQLTDLTEIKQQLLERVDIIPVDLVLMQAANESGWGTSRFAVEANNLFGQWCFRKGCGVIPKGRPEGETYEVRKFSTPADSIRGYFHNLNTGQAYSDLRLIRSQQRAETQQLDATGIAEGLLPYSTRREAYVEEIQQMLRINKKYI